jgi:hypothetical protein
MQQPLTATAGLCRRPSFNWTMIFVLFPLCSAGAVASAGALESQQVRSGAVIGEHPALGAERAPRVTAVMGVRG